MTISLRSWKSEHSLKEFTDPKNFKPYEELKRKLNEVLGMSETFAPSAKPRMEDVASQKPSFEAPKQRKSVEDTAPWSEEDEDLNYFKALAED